MKTVKNVKLTDPVYDQLKMISKNTGVTMSKLCERGAEMFLRVFTQHMNDLKAKREEEQHEQSTPSSGEEARPHTKDDPAKRRESGSQEGEIPEQEDQTDDSSQTAQPHTR